MTISYRLTAAAAGLTLGRVTLGTALAVAPGLIGRLWLGPDGTARHRQRLQLLGVRDLVLCGALLYRPDLARRWFLLGAGADLFDAVISLGYAARHRRAAAALVAAMAAAGAGTSFTLARSAGGPVRPPSAG